MDFDDRNLSRGDAESVEAKFSLRLRDSACEFFWSDWRIGHLMGQSPKNQMSWHRGGCHCGAVAYEVQTPDEIELIDCNCSMCFKTGYLHLIVPKSRFKLVRGQEVLTTYTFNTGAAKHMFCKVCGIKSFYVPRSHPDGYSVNFRCLDAGEFKSIMTTEFDGQHWELHAGELSQLEPN